VDAVEQHPAGHRRALGKEADERKAGDGLPAAGLADDAEHLAALDREGEPVDGMDGAVLGGEADGEIGDLEQRHGIAARTAGATASISKEPSGSSSRQRSRTRSLASGSSLFARPAEVPTPSVATAHHSSKPSYVTVAMSSLSSTRRSSFRRSWAACRG